MINLIHISIIIFIYHNDFLNTDIDDKNLSKDFLKNINQIFKALNAIKENKQKKYF